MTTVSSLLIIGASVRAAAASALRAGLSPICVDRFGDEDLRNLANVVSVADRLRDALPAIRSLPRMPWMYCGPLENDLEFVTSVSEQHSLCGCSIEAVSIVRDPFWLAAMMKAAELPVPDVCPITDPSSMDGRWLLKPWSSGGGLGISEWHGQTVASPSSMFLQRFCDGTPISGLFLANSKGVELVGLCEQLIGRTHGAPFEFGYSGSIGPIEVSPHQRNIVARTGREIALRAGLLGLFGCDFVLDDKQQTVWLVEVNPRYTASVEVLERSLGRNLLADHAAAFGNSEVIAIQTARSNNERVVGKRIVFAESDIVAPNLKDLFEQDTTLIADIPRRESRIAAGWPICTVFAVANSRDECRSILTHRSDAVWRRCLDPSAGIGIEA